MPCRTTSADHEFRAAHGRRASGSNATATVVWSWVLGQQTSFTPPSALFCHLCPCLLFSIVSFSVISVLVCSSPSFLLPSLESSSSHCSPPSPSSPSSSAADSAIRAALRASLRRPPLARVRASGCRLVPRCGVRICQIMGTISLGTHGSTAAPTA